MSDTAFDRGKFALQRVLNEVLSNLSIGQKINERGFSEKHTFIVSCFSCFFLLERPRNCWYGQISTVDMRMTNEQLIDVAVQLFEKARTLV
jgi:CRISPR/Cas system CMR-associated protein Cmr1 (group 7 of RAMP superfamily)